MCKEQHILKTKIEKFVIQNRETSLKILVQAVYMVYTDIIVAEYAQCRINVAMIESLSICVRACVR